MTWVLPFYFVKFEICSVRFLTESALWSAVQTPIRIKTSREAQSHCAKTQSNAYARTDQAARPCDDPVTIAPRSTTGSPLLAVHMDKLSCGISIPNRSVCRH